MSYEDAKRNNLLHRYSDGSVKIDTAQCPSSGCPRWPGGNRPSVRLESKKTYNGGLFILNARHIPFGCGTWPAWWLVGPDWPNNGEIDIIEAVNDENLVATTLHTRNGCTQNGVNPNSFQGDWALKQNNRDPATNCFIHAPGQWGNQGCGQQYFKNTYRAKALSGSVWATEWVSNSHIKTWVWARGAEPADVKSGRPNPASWGKPMSLFQLGSSCPPAFFKTMQIVINLTFCGDWAGNTFPQMCPSVQSKYGSCNNYISTIKSLPDAHWHIDYIKVFQMTNGPAPPASNPTIPTPPAPVSPSFVPQDGPCRKDAAGKVDGTIPVDFTRIAASHTQCEQACAAQPKCHGFEIFKTNPTSTHCELWTTPPFGKGGPSDYKCYVETKSAKPTNEAKADKPAEKEESTTNWAFVIILFVAAIVGGYIFFKYRHSDDTEDEWGVGGQTTVRPKTYDSYDDTIGYLPPPPIENKNEQESERTGISIAPGDSPWGD